MYFEVAVHVCRYLRHRGFIILQPQCYRFTCDRQNQTVRWNRSRTCTVSRDGNCVCVRMNRAVLPRLLIAGLWWWFPELPDVRRLDGFVAMFSRPFGLLTIALLIWWGSMNSLRNLASVARCLRVCVDNINKGAAILLPVVVICSSCDLMNLDFWEWQCLNVHFTIVIFTVT